MSDDDLALAGAVDPVRPRTIKALSDRTWDRITMSARKEGITVGQWLERRVDQWVAEGEPIASNPLAAPQPHSLADLAQAMNAARELAEAAGVRVPGVMAREGLALVRQATRAARGLSPTAPPKQALSRSETPPK